MTYFGGPTRAGAPAPGDVVEHAGHGLVIGTGGTPRAGVVAYRGTGDRNRGRAFSWVGASTPGDSGSAVRKANGAAVGNLTHLVLGSKYAPGNVAGTTIARMLQIADRRLATAPNVPDPSGCRAAPAGGRVTIAGMPVPEFIRDLRRSIGHDLLWMPAVTAVVVDASSVLMVRRADNGRWAPVSGILEPGEQPAVCAAREVLEETRVVGAGTASGLGDRMRAGDARQR